VLTDTHIIDAMDSDVGLKGLSTFLSRWKLAATSIELSFTIRQLDEELQRPSLKDKADRNLCKLAVTLFGQGMDSESVDFVANMVKGVSPVVVGKVSITQLGECGR
jgi:mediator of RNA polymerase II transcription subunit 12, fungi type